jgi:hypothetical protein
MRRLFVCALPIPLLVGCAVIDSNIGERVIGVNFSLDRAASDTVLTNILRASESQSLTFVSISKISGTQSVTLKNGLPTFNFGPDLTVAQKQFVFGNNTVDNLANGSFDVGLLVSRDFTKGLLAEIGLEELELFIRQGASRELVFNLAVEAFVYEIPDPKRPDSFITEILANEPRHTSFDDFRRTVAELVRFGFTLESRQEKNDLYDKDDKSGSQPRIVVRSQFCFDPTLNRPRYPFPERWRCGGVWKNTRPAVTQPGPPDTQGRAKNAQRGDRKDKPKEGRQPSAAKTAASTAKPNEKTILAPAPPSIAKKLSDQGIRIDPRAVTGAAPILYRVTVRVRSIQGAFTYLGRLVAEDRMRDVLVLEEPDLIEGRRSRLLQIERDSKRNCFSSVRFNGESYCVPAEASANTKRTFAIMSQLINLKTSPGDIPFTPTVRITP